jgi:hypothetical protein
MEGGRVNLDGRLVLRFRRTVSIIEPGGVYLTGSGVRRPGYLPDLAPRVAAVYPDTGRVRDLMVDDGFRYDTPAPFRAADLAPAPGEWAIVTDRRRGRDGAAAPQVSPQT